MMMLSQTSRRWVQQQGSPKNLIAAVKERLLGSDPPPIGDGRVDEFPEDVVIVLLLDPQLDDVSRRAVASGWNAALDQVHRLLRDPLLGESTARALQRPFTRVFRVAELSEHDLLRKGVRVTLPLVLGDDSEASVLQRQEVVAAALAYRPDEVDRSQWERALRNHPEVAGFAFRMLLKLDADEPDAGSVSRYFEELVERQFGDEWKWNIDVWFLSGYVISALKTDKGKPIVDALVRIAEQNSKLWEKIKAESKANPCWSREIAGQVERRLIDRGKPNVIVRPQRRPEAAEAHQANEIENLPISLSSRQMGLVIGRKYSTVLLVSPTIKGVRRLSVADGWEVADISLRYDLRHWPSKSLVKEGFDWIQDFLERKVELRSLPAEQFKDMPRG